MRIDGMSLIAAAEKHASNYEGDDRQTTTDVLNAFYAGAKFADTYLTDKDIMNELVQKLPLPRMISIEEVDGQYAMTMIYDTKSQCNRLDETLDKLAEHVYDSTVK